jgi:hypothetical protein
MIETITSIYIIVTIYVIMQIGTRVQQRHCLIKQPRKWFE